MCRWMRLAAASGSISVRTAPPPEMVFKSSKERGQLACGGREHRLHGSTRSVAEPLDQRHLEDEARTAVASVETCVTQRRARAAPALVSGRA